MQIRKLKKMNLQDGDLIFLPEEHFTASSIEQFIKAIRDYFPEKRIMFGIAPKDGIKEIKIINLNSIKEKKNENQNNAG